MYLSQTEIQISNKKREVISKYFLKGARLCNNCGGTGLKDVHTNIHGDSSWDGSSFCEKCKGTGFLKWNDSIEMKLCPKCNGGGLAANGYGNIKCTTCDGQGILDWIQYMRVGEKNG